MKYMLLVYGDENLLSNEELQACYAESTELVREIDAAGQFVATSPLESVRAAKSVRVRDGRRLVTDGPFAETREQLGGFYLVDVGSLDEALAIAERIPMARRGTVEVRPVHELTGLPDMFVHDARAEAAGDGGDVNEPARH